MEAPNYNANAYYANPYMQQGAPMNTQEEDRPSYVQQAQPVGSFEPDDPIPDIAENTTDRKHRPKFVDFFMRKNSDDNK